MGERTRNFSSRAGAGVSARAGIAAVVAVAAAWAVGCTAPRGPLVVSSRDPSVKIPAIKKAVRSGDRGAARQLVDDLQSDDPAVRFYAISGLHRITGERFGYDYFADERQRQPAVQRWRDWLAAREPVRTTGDKGTR